MTIPTDKAKDGRAVKCVALASDTARDNTLKAILDAVLKERQHNHPYLDYADAIEAMRRAAEALSPQGAVAGEWEMEDRFFIDHDMIHDRASGQHVCTEKFQFECHGGSLEATCAMLNNIFNYGVIACIDILDVEIRHADECLAVPHLTEAARREVKSWHDGVFFAKKKLERQLANVSAIDSYPLALKNAAEALSPQSTKLTSSKPKAAKGAVVEEESLCGQIGHKPVEGSYMIKCERCDAYLPVRDIPPTKPNDAGLSDKTDRELLALKWKDYFPEGNADFITNGKYDRDSYFEVPIIVALAAMSRVRSAGAGFVVTEERVEAAAKAFRDEYCHKYAVTPWAELLKMLPDDIAASEISDLRRFVRTALTAAANVGEGRG